GAKEDRAPSGPPADPGAVGGSVVIGGSSTPAPAPAPAGTTTPPPAGSPAPTTPAPGGPGSFLDMPLHKGFSPRLGVPVPEVRPMVSMADQKRLGVASGGTEVRVPVVHVTF